MANSAMVITADVHVEVTAVPRGWPARIVDAAEDVRWATSVLGNPFVLRFPDDSTFTVGVEPADDQSLLRLRDWDRERDRPRSCLTCGAAMIWDGFTIFVDGRSPDAPLYRSPRCGVGQGAHPGEAR